MAVTLQDTVWFVLYRNQGKVFRLVDVVEEVGKIRSGHIGSAAVNACLDRLVRAGEVQKGLAPSGASIFQVTHQPT